ncbi:MAG: hypothetical protein JO072_07635 [Parafilimonas sp.]|nr:hypothetical protein [Parafilimonas sp.]
MNSKRKTILALTVKLLFSFICLQAQTTKDSAKTIDPRLPVLYTNISLIKYPVVQKQIPGNFYAKQLPFFCNKELQVQKALGVSIKFRVGSVEYCDKLEGKNNH